MKKNNSQKSLKNLRLVMGKHCVQELARFAPERIVEVYCSVGNELDPLLLELQKLSLPIRHLSKTELNQKLGSESHQSFAAAVKEKGSLSLNEFLKRSESLETSLVVMLDSIFDPQNLGSILRAAECFGADAVVWSKNRGTDVTPVVSKASVGASELMELIKVSNISEAMRQFQKAGYWSIAAEVSPEAQSIYTFQFPEKALIILGSEGQGVQRIVSENSDHHVIIPMKGRIDSINVSQAAAVMLSHYRRFYDSDN